MKPAPHLEPCDIEAMVPEPLLRASDDAGRRKDAALDRLLIKLDVDGRGAELQRLIDADQALHGRGK